MALAQASRSRVSQTRKGGIITTLVLTVFLALAFAPGPAAQETNGQKLIAADRALQLAAAGKMIVVDVRSPQEWRQTGVPEGARTVTIHQPDGLIGFVDAMNAMMGNDHSRPIALICARGTRSTLAYSALAEAGYTQLYNIREGMLGSPDGPGWLTRGLPTEPCAKC